MQPNPVRVFVVEDEAWVRDALEHALRWNEGGVTLAASASDGASALRLLDGGVPFDVALVDLGLPDMRGSELIARIRARRPSAVSVVFTVYDDAPNILEAVRAGAQGYLLKSSPVERVLAGLREAGEGGAPMSPAIARLVLDALRNAPPSPPGEAEGSTLTKREREVLALLAKGSTYAETAAILGIGVGTVQGHVKRIYDKLQVDSKAEAAATAQRMGLI